uniref:Uncharacterized protein n=1 Tax=Caenorhabditis japonica TaxID=281687 RepID=A0A8R1HZH4_CAEJA
MCEKIDIANKWHMVRPPACPTIRQCFLRDKSTPVDRHYHKFLLLHLSNSKRENSVSVAVVWRKRKRMRMAGALGMPPFRERLGTGCTKDSKDSGIEVRPKAKRQRNRHRARMQTSSRKKPISSPEEPTDNRNEDAKQNVENTIVIGLWMMVLYVTNLSFGLPFQILWPARINHAAVALSYLLIGIWVLCALYFYLRKRNSEMRWHETYPKTYYFAWVLQVVGFGIFCLATYPQIQRWSFLVSIFYFFFFATISNTFL